MQGQGGHWLNKFLVVDKITFPPGVSKVSQLADDVPFKANVTIKSLKGKKYVKLEESSMFPKNWSLERIKEEVAWVYEKAINDSNLIKIKTTTTKLGRMEAECSSGFKIRIEFDMKKNILNAYPVIN